MSLNNDVRQKDQIEYSWRFRKTWISFCQRPREKELLEEREWSTILNVAEIGGRTEKMQCVWQEETAWWEWEISYREGGDEYYSQRMEQLV